jgi:hypothetical protein
LKKKVYTTLKKGIYYFEKNVYTQNKNRNIMIEKAVYTILEISGHTP